MSRRSTKWTIWRHVAQCGSICTEKWISLIIVLYRLHTIADVTGPLPTRKHTRHLPRTSIQPPDWETLCNTPREATHVARKWGYPDSRTYLRSGSRTTTVPRRGTAKRGGEGVPAACHDRHTAEVPTESQVHRTTPFGEPRHRPRGVPSVIPTARTHPQRKTDHRTQSKPHAP